LLPRASVTPIVPLLFLVLLSALTSAFKVQFPIASGSNMSVSYVVDIAALILRGPHAAMIVGAAGGWSQTTLNSRTPNPPFRTLFNMSILVLTVQAAGQVFLRLGGRPNADPAALIMPLAGTALTYFFVNPVPIAVAILQAAHDAIITMDHALNIREFNPAAEQMFGYARLGVLGRNVEMLLPPADRSEQVRALNQYLTTGRGPLAGRQVELRGLRA